jgi:hypothetical protein
MKLSSTFSLSDITSANQYQLNHYRVSHKEILKIRRKNTGPPRSVQGTGLLPEISTAG